MEGRGRNIYWKSKKEIHVSWLRHLAREYISLVDCTINKTNIIHAQAFNLMDCVGFTVRVRKGKHVVN